MKAAKRHNRSALTPARLSTRRVRLIFVSAVFLSVAITALYLTSPPPVEAVGSTTIVISQIYGGGGNGSATYKNDFIELYNLGNTTVDLTGWSVQYTNDVGTSWSVTNLSGLLAPGRYYLVQEASGGAVGASLPTSDATGTINLAAGAGKVALVSNNTALTGSCPSGGGIVDFVGYGTSANCFEGAGPQSPGPGDNATSVIRKNGGNQDTDNNNLDFTRISPPVPRNKAFFATSSIAFDASSRGCQFFNLLTGPTLTWQHTVGSGSNRILIIGISTDTVTSAGVAASVPAPRVASVTYNGQLLTRVDDTSARSAGNESQVEMFRLLEAQMPAAGTYTVSVTLTLPVNVSTYVVGGGVSFSGVDQATPFNTGQTSSTSNVFARSPTNVGASTSPSVTVVSNPGEVVVDTVSSVFTGAGQALLTVAGPLQVERWNGAKAQGADPACFSSSGDSIGAGSTEQASSTSVNMAWTLSTSKRWSIGAVSVRPASTLVELASFDATQMKSGVMLNWRTGYEVNNLGFNLYREQNGKRVRVNPSIIAGSALLIGQGAAMTAGDSYSWFDPQGTSDSLYYLEDIDLDATRKQSGPAQPAASTSGNVNAGQKQAMLLSELNAQAATASGISKWQKGWPAATGVGRELLYNINGKPGFDLQHLIASKGAVKLSVNKEGWYRVTQADLVAAGFNENVDARTLQLYSNGAEVPLLMNAAKQQFSPGDSFEFYGTGLDTPTTDTNTYWLMTENGKGLRITPQPHSATPAQTTAASITRAQAQQGNGSQVLTASPSAQRIPANVSQPYPLNWIIVPTPSPAVSETESVKPENAGVSVPKAELSRDDSVNAPASAPPKKSRRSKKRTRKARLKASSRNHALLRPVNLQSYPYTVELKERLIYISSLINGETENFYGKVISSSAASQQLVLENLSQNADGTTQLEIALQGYTLTTHQVKVKINGQDVGTVNFNNQEHTVAQLSVPSSALLEGENTVTLERSGGDTDVSLVDWIRLTYEHSYHADGGVLRFTASGSTRLDGFAYNNIRVMDISDPRRVKEIACKVEASSNGYAAILQAPKEGEYIAFTDNEVNHPASVKLDKPSDLKSSNNGADLVIISYGDFIQSVQPLAELRRKEGLAVSVVDVEDVYDEFSSGAHSPYAIKDFLSWAKTHWQKAPEFVLLVGDAGLDPRNYLGNGITDFVPTKLIDASTMETASDDWLADFNNDGVVGMAVGRLPVRTKAEANQVVAKITGYTSSNAQQQVLMVVDKNNPNDNFSFAQTGAELGALLPPSVSINTISRASSNDDAALRSQIINAINQGPLMVNYLGHGSVEVWTGAPILSTTDTTALNNTNRLPIFVMMTCLNGYFPNPARDSLAEALLRNNGSGAVAVWASSGMTEPNAQSQMNKQLYSQVFNTDGTTLGEAVQKAKEGVTDRDVRRTWILFGDPTMRIK